MIVLRTVSSLAPEVTLTENQLATVVIRATGGGWTEEQTSEAMALQSQIYRAEGPVEFNYKGSIMSLEYTA
jgi:hypothetical protein